MFGLLWTSFGLVDFILRRLEKAKKNEEKNSL